MTRELDLIDVWFDSGAMPYAQVHYPFEGTLDGVFPADFVAEGRGPDPWMVLYATCHCYHAFRLSCIQKHRVQRACTR